MKYIKYLIIVVVVLLLRAYHILDQQEYTQVVFLDVGQGSAAYVRADTGFTMLIDAGETNKTLRSLAKFHPWWNKNINVLVASHPDKDHIGMFPKIIRRYDVDVFIETGKKSLFGPYVTLKDELRTRGILEKNFKPMDRLEVSPGVHMLFLHPSLNEVDELSDNDTSLIFILDVYGTTFLFMGDASKKIEQELIRKYKNLLNVDVLVVGHHGSNTSTDGEFLSKVAPSYGVISSGAENKYGHPHNGVLERLEDVGTQVLRTDELGNIQFKIATDGTFDIMVR